MQFLAIVSHIRFEDVLDILFLSIVTYHLYHWFQNTKALRMLVGLLALGFIYTLAQSWGLFLTTWMFQILWQVLIILLIILFQSEIRQVLERVNPLKTLGWHKGAAPAAWIESLTEACFNMARRRIGALVIIERTNRVEEWITDKTYLEGDPTPAVLLSIFQKESPLHDGAVLIRSGRVVAASCYLPLSSTEGLPQQWGTRHRAGLGLSERCDAWSVVVSEQRGEVSLARAGAMETIKEPAQLSQTLQEFEQSANSAEQTFMQKVRSLALNRWRLKLGCLALVSIVWLLLAGQQDFEVRISVPVQLRNLPRHLEIVEPLKPSVHLTVRGLRKDASTFSSKDVQIRLDLSNASLELNTYRINRNQIVLPSGLIELVRIEPSELVFAFREKGQLPSNKS